MLGNLFNLGVNKNSKDLNSKVRLTNQLALILAVTSLPYILVFSKIKPMFSTLIVPLVGLYLGTLIWNRFSMHNAARFYVLSIGNLAVFSYALFLGRDSGIHVVFLSFLVVPYFLFLPEEGKKTIFGCLISVFSYFLLQMLYRFGPVQESILSENHSFIVSIAVYAATVAIIMASIVAFLKSIQYYKEQFIGEKRENYRISELLHQADKKNSMLALMNEYHHELKSPWSTLMMATELDDMTIDRLKGMIKRQYERVEGLMQLMISILKGEHERTESLLNIAEIIESVTETLNIRAIDIEVESDDQIPSIMGNSMDLQILFVNLYKNATEALIEKHNERRIYIKNYYKKEDNSVRTEFSDTGMGMTTEAILNLEKSRFSNSTKLTGSGLGLSVIRRIVEEHKGSLDIQSVEGEGTTFTIAFPAIVK